MLEKLKQLNFSDPKNIAFLALIVGVIFIVFPQGLLTGVMVLIGLAGIIFGAFHIYNYFQEKEEKVSNQLIIGLTFAALGLFFVIRAGFLRNVVTVVFGIMVLLYSFYLAQFAFELKKEKLQNWLVNLIMAGVVFVLSVVLLCGCFTSNGIVKMVITGITLVLSGLSYIVSDLLLERIGVERKAVVQNEFTINEKLFTSTFEGVKNTVSDVVEKINEKKEELKEKKVQNDAELQQEEEKIETVEAQEENLEQEMKNDLPIK